MTDGVTEGLCVARMESLKQQLDTIERNGLETRKGVGNINRRLFEGNGSPPLDSQIQQNTEFRKSRQKTNAAWLLAGAGWSVSVMLLVVGWALSR